MRNSEHTVSLLICTRNRADSLKRCLDSISASEMQEIDGELILVNNGSSDDTGHVMEAFKTAAPFSVAVVNEQTPGLSRARNAALAKATGTVIVFTDDDCYLTSGYLLRASRIFDSGQFDYCGGRLLQYDPTDSEYCCCLRNEFRLYPPHSFLGTGELHGANLLFHRRVIEKVGLFDPMFGAGTPFRCEDIDYCARASLAGFTGAFVPELAVYHHHGRKPRTPELQRLKHDNDYAGGAYYMKFALLGQKEYLKNWIWRFLTKMKLRIALRQLRGAIHYALARRRKTTEVE